MTSITRRWWLLAIAGAPVVLGVSAQTLLPRLDGDYLRVTAPNLQFLTGKAFDRLKVGNTVSYNAQLTVATGRDKIIQARAVAHFDFSYDIWEERFKVTLLIPGLSRSSAKNLTAAAAQAWCLENLKIDLANVPSDRPIWVRLEMRVEDPKDSEGVIRDGISLNALIGLLSQGRPQQQHFVEEIGPLKLSDLRKPHS